MPDNIERTIYKLELDGEGYISGVNAITASTAKLTAEQERTNKTLQTNEAALKSNSDRLAKAKKDLEDYAGTNARYRKQLEGDVKSAEKDQAKLTELVNGNRQAYEKATKAATDFANASARATELQQQAGGGKIPGPTVIPTVIPQVGAGLQDALKNISLGDLPESLNKVIPEFEALRTVIAEAKARMNELNAEDEEFKQLAPIVKQGEEALKLYDDATKSTAGSQQSLRAQLRQSKEELVRLEQAGKGASAEYLELEKRTAKLTDEFADQQQRIRILASDTKLLDFGKGAITAATSAFQVYTSISILAGDESAELQKKTMQLFAAMQLLQSLEQLSNLTRREGVLATLAQSGAQSVYTAVVGASTGALKAFRLALLGTGILAAVVAIGYLVVKYNQMKEAAAKANAESKLLNDVREKAIEGYAKEVSQLEVLRIKLSTLSTPQNERIRLAKEYNKTADESAKIDLKQINAIDLLNAAIDRQIEKIKERALAQAAANLAEEKANVLLKAEQKVIELAPKFNLNLPEIDRQIKNVQASIDDLSFKEWTKENVELTKHLQELRGALLDVKSANEDFNRTANLAATVGPKCPDGYHWDPKTNQCIKDNTTPTKSAAENVFEQERQKQRERLAELLRKSVEDEKTIRAQFEEQLKAEVIRINNLLRDKKLTTTQSQTLKLEAANINTVELDKALKDYQKKVADARKKIDDELKDLQNKAVQDSISLLQDEFERRRKIIDFNEQKEIADAKENTDDRLKALDLDRLLIGEENYQRDRLDIITIGEQNVNNIIARFSSERGDLAFDIFKDTLANVENYIQFTDLQISEAANREIQNLSERFLSGEIGFERYQKELTKIQKKSELERKQSALDTERDELRILENTIATSQKLQIKQLEELIKKRDELRAKISSDQTSIDTTTNTDTNDESKKKAEEVVKYAEVIGQLTDSVIQFWQKANEAEQKALDRSIELQEKRVTAAQRIAERGNAQYLKEEEDRLNELNVKRENAARKQLGIDAALQASQLLVAITGAIAKIATPGIGIAETIGAIAVIVGSLATGYGLVKSLQGNQPKLAEGTTFVSRGRNPKGKDTIPAWLNEGEAVIPAEKNNQYKKSIEAIYHGKVPAKTLNTFVEHYVSGKIKPVPLPNYSKFRDVAEMHVSHDGKVAGLIHEQNRKIDEGNDLQRQTLRALKSMGVNVNMDKTGIAVSVMEVIDEISLDRKK